MGLTQQLPVDEKHNYSREYLADQIAMREAAIERPFDEAGLAAAEARLAAELRAEFGEVPFIGAFTLGQIARLPGEKAFP